MGNLLSEDGKPTFGADQDEYTEEGLLFVGLTVVQKKQPKQERVLLDIHQKELVVNKRNTHCKGWHGYLEGWSFITETWGGCLQQKLYG